MTRTTTPHCLLLAALLTLGCAGTDAPIDDNSTSSNTPNNSNPNATPNSSANSNPNSAPNGTPNNAPNATPNNTTNANPNNAPNSTPNNGTNDPQNNAPNNTPSEWRALVANADLTGNESTWNLVVFDGTSASATVPQSFGTGEIEVAATAGEGYVIDLETGMMLVIDAERGTEIETIDLGVTDLDAVAAGEGIIVAASGDNATIAQYSAAAGGLRPPVPLPSASPGTSQFVRGLAMDGNLIAGVMEESAMFPTTPQLFVADSGLSQLIDVDPTMDGPLTLGTNGANRLDSLGGELFAVATNTDGILIFRADGATWVTDQVLMTRAAFGNAEIEGVIMADATHGVALTYTDRFAAFAFDSSTGMATEVDGLALPTGLIGGDASGDGLYFFVGDYGVRNEPNAPWGVGIVDRDGALLDHVMTDDALPPSDIAALN